MREDIRELIDKLNYYTKLYDEGNPAISDKEWDDLYFNLKQQEELLGLIYPDSPTQTIHYTTVDGLEEVEHDHLMLSLDKTQDIEEFKTFIGEHDIITMLKMDGLTCTLKYEHGQLVKAETRGGKGIKGFNILHNAKVVGNIPQTIPFLNDLIVDGEIICDYKNFEKFSDKYANPRNFAAGSIKLYNSEESASRQLSFIAWDCIKGLDKINSLSDKLIALEKLGFTIVPFLQPDKNYTIEENIDFLKNEAVIRNYPIDGIVVKYDDVEYYNSLGNTEHHFRGGMAFKFYDEEYDTELLNIEWSLGRTGVLTPVAIYKDVDTGDSIINRASLHNMSILEEILGMPFEGQKIKVCKQNEIIPQVTWAEKWTTDKPFLLHAIACPCCNTPTEIKDNDGIKTLWCTNPNCEGKLVNIIDHFVGKKGLDVKGLSKATIEKLIEAGWVNRRADIFKLSDKQKEWANMSGFGVKSVSNILTAIERAKDTNFEIYLSSLGIPLIGTSVSRELSKVFSNYNDFRKAIREGYDFSQLKGFGPEMHKSLSSYDYTEADEMAQLLNFKTVSESVVSNSAENLTFCITGKVHTWKNRDELKKYIESIGGKVVGSMSSNVNYLINNDATSTSAKNTAAKKAGIPILTEENFIEKFGQ